MNWKRVSKLLGKFLDFLLRTKVWYPRFQNMGKGAFIVYCNAAALPMYNTCLSTAAHGNALRIKFTSFAVPQCSSRRRDGNTTSATYRNADAVDYERTLRRKILVSASIQHNYVSTCQSWIKAMYMLKIIITLPTIKAHESSYAWRTDRVWRTHQGSPAVSI